jgi:hypothetical protein
MDGKNGLTVHVIKNELGIELFKIFFNKSRRYQKAGRYLEGEE